MKNIGSLLLDRLHLTNGKLHGQLALYEKAGFLGDSAPMRGVRCPHIPSLDRLRESRVLRGGRPYAGCGVSPHSPFPLQVENRRF